MRVLMIGQTQAQTNFLGSTPYQRMRKPSLWKKLMRKFLYFCNSQRHSTAIRYPCTKLTLDDMCRWCIIIICLLC